MRVETIGLDDQQRRSTVVANEFDRLRRGFVQGLEVPRVGVEDTRAKGLSARANVAGDGHGLRRRLAVTVVLAHDQMRKIPQVRNVCCFVQDAFAKRAFANEGNDDRFFAREFSIERHSGRDRQETALLTVGNETLVAKMLAAANSCANALYV